jgi:hypothetical protein
MLLPFYSYFANASRTLDDLCHYSYTGCPSTCCIRRQGPPAANFTKTAVLTNTVLYTSGIFKISLHHVHNTVGPMQRNTLCRELA